jgi:hypothetical protein
MRATFPAHLILLDLSISSTQIICVALNRAVGDHTVTDYFILTMILTCINENDIYNIQLWEIFCLVIDLNSHMMVALQCKKQNIIFIKLQ